MTLYSNEIRVYLRDIKWPKGFIFRPVSYKYYLAIVIYRDNFLSLPAEDIRYLETKIGETIQWIREQGVPCKLEVRLNAPA